MPGLNMMTPETLLPLIGAPDAPVLIDVCIDEDFALDPRLIPGAFRHSFTDIEALAPALINQEVVIICQKGFKLSQGAGALLRAHGLQAKALIGGMVGCAARGYPAVPAAALPKPRFVAAEAPTSNAVAALWLIKRFVRSDTQIMFVAEETLEAVADRFDATPLMPFSDLQNELGLDQPSLTQIAETLAGNTPEAAGITAALTGLRALNSSNQSYMAATLPLFNALHCAFRNASDTPSEGAAT